MSKLSPNQIILRRAINGARAVHSIAKHPRLYLAVDGRGGGSWRIKYRPRPAATQRWHTLSDDARNANFDDVVRKATELLTNLTLHGVDPRATRPRRADTFDDTFKAWLEHYAKVHKRSWAADDKLYLRHVERRLGNDATDAIDRPRIIEVLDDIAIKATPLQANRCQSLISAVFSWALDEGRIRSHPALRIRRRGQETQREFVLTYDQLRSFWKELDELRDNASTILKLLLFLGCRLGEIAGMRHDEIRPGSPHQWVLPGDRTKNGLAHIVPLPPAAALLIQSARDETARNPFVFPARRISPTPFDGNHVSRQCKAIFRNIGVDHMRLHDLRHQAATGMAECGVPLDIRQLVQNQITGRRQTIGARYDQHDYLMEKLKALRLWENRLLAIVQDRAPPTDRY